MILITMLHSDCFIGKTILISTCKKTIDNEESDQEVEEELNTDSPRLHRRLSSSNPDVHSQIKKHDQGGNGVSNKTDVVQKAIKGAKSRSQIVEDLTPNHDQQSCNHLITDTGLIQLIIFQLYCCNR